MVDHVRDVDPGSRAGGDGVSSSSFVGFVLGGTLLGLGTAMVYPTLLAAIGDVAASGWRVLLSACIGLWRDLGYVAGALVAGIAADSLGFTGAIWIVAALTCFSGVMVAIRMTETLPRPAGALDVTGKG